METIEELLNQLDTRTSTLKAMACMGASNITVRAQLDRLRDTLTLIETNYQEAVIADKAA